MLYVFAPQQTEAQILKRILKKTEKKVESEAEKRTEKRINKKIDKTFDEAEDTIDGKKKKGEETDKEKPNDKVAKKTNGNADPNEIQEPKKPNASGLDELLASGTTQLVNLPFRFQLFYILKASIVKLNVFFFKYRWLLGIVYISLV